MDDRIGTYACHRKLGLSYGMTGGWTQSDEHFMISLKIVEYLISPFNFSHLFFEWARVEKNRGKKKEAKNYSKRL